MEAVMGESGEASKEAADSSSTGESGEVHVNGDMNGSCEAMDVDEAAIITTKSVSEIINNKSDPNDIGDNCESDSDSIINKTNSCGKVPNEDSVKSSELGTEVPNNNIEQDPMEVEEHNSSVELIKDSDSENILSGDESVLGSDLPKVANSVHGKKENYSACVDGVKEPDEDSNGVFDTTDKIVVKKVTENGEVKLSFNVDIDELSNDSTKREASTSDMDKNESNDNTEDNDGDEKGTETKSGETTPAKVKKSRKSLPPANITPRRSSRNLSRAQKSYSEPKEEEAEEENEPVEDNDPDIEEITPVDPLADPVPMDRLPISRPRINHNRKTTIVVSDTKKLVEIAAGARSMKGGKKEPTLVIIDTNSILSGRGPIPISQTNSHNHSHSHSHSHTITTIPSTSSSGGYSVLPVTLPSQTMMYPKHRTTQQHIPIHIPKPHPPPPPQPPPPPPPQILPTLTDDMYVVEAPSFIVPYVYEKPPIKPLKEYIKKLSDEIKRLTKLEEEAEKKEKEDREKSIKDKKKKDDEEKCVEDQKKKEDEEKCVEDQKKKEDEEKCMEDEKKNVEEKLDQSNIEAEVEKDKKVSKESDDKESNDIESNDEKEKTKVEEEEESSKSEGKLKDDKIDETVMSEDSGNAEKSTENDSDKEKQKGKESKIISLDDPSNKSSEKQTEESIEEVITLDDSKKEKVLDEKDKEEKPKTLSYFDNPLGKFFMQIGTSLVTESVQTQLLREQKRKRDRDTGKVSASTQVVINHLLNNLELSKENNQHFHLPIKKCEFCSFRTESALVMAQHLETPHMRNYVYRCNFCPLEVRSPHDILFHMEAEHNVRGRLERAPAFHQCPNCPFEDNQKGKLTRHLISCSKKYKADKNLEPPPDWEPPAKIPRISRNRPMAGGLGAAAYQAMVKQQLPQQQQQQQQQQHPQHPLLPKLPPSLTAMPGAMRGRGRPMGPSGQARYLPDMKTLNAQSRNMSPVSTTMRPGMLYRPSGSGSQPQVLLPTSYQIAGNQIFQVVGNQGQMIPMTSQGSRLTASSHSSGGPTPVALVPNIAAGSSTITIQSTSKQQQATAKLMQQPSISITPLPRQPAMSSPHSNAVHNRQSPGQQAQGSGKTSFVICEICDGYIKDLDQLRNHMMWIHKVKIHPKMIYNRPPLNCQKCQFRFFTDQGLERHLLGSHGLVTSSMQEAANKGKDAGRCPICGRVYQWKLLNHVARDHSMTLKPAHLSYKCTVCTATFGMYKQFENHVYSAHSVVAKRVMEKKSSPQITRPQPSESLLKSSVKLTDEITIIPQANVIKPGPASKTGKMNVLEQTSTVHRCDVCDASFDGPNGFVQYLTHHRRRHLRRCAVKLCRLDSCPTCKRRHLTPRLTDILEEKKGVDVIELSDDEIVIAGQGRNEITITKVASAPGPRRFKQLLQKRSVQIIDLDSPQKSGAARENGEDALTAVKERLRRRKSLEISQIDSEGSDDGPAKKRRRIDN